MGAKPEDVARAHRIAQHAAQVADGKIPPDSPPDFVLPADPVDRKGLPWWFGPDYHPTEQAIEQFETP